MQTQEPLRSSTRKASPFILRLKTLRLESAKSNNKAARSTIIRHGAPIPVSAQKEPLIKPANKDAKTKQSEIGFDLDEVSSFCVEDDGNPRSPFKLLKFEEEITPTKTVGVHRRQPSMIVNNIKQSYSFEKVYDIHKVPSDGDLTPTLTPHKQTPIPFFRNQDSEELSDFSFSDQESAGKEKPSITKIRGNCSTTPKDSFFASTVEPKSTIYNNSEIRSSLFSSESGSIKKDERKSTIYTLSSESSSKFMYTYSSDRTDTANLSPPLTDRAQGNTTTQGFNTQERDSIEASFFAGASSKFDFERGLKAPKVKVKGKKDSEKLAYGLIPMKAFCSKCGTEVMTVVDMKLPSAPFWKSFFCFRDMITCCNDLNALNKYQEITHSCSRCKRLLIRLQPL